MHDPGRKPGDELAQQNARHDLQRLEPDQEKYAEKLAVLHKMLLAAMKCKQTTDLSNVNQLRSLLKEFEVLYFGHSIT